MTKPGVHSLFCLTSTALLMCWQSTAFGFSCFSSIGDPTLSSASGAYRIELSPVDEGLRGTLYQGQTPIAEYPLPFSSYPSIQHLLDDGSYLAFENSSCESSGLAQQILVMDAAGRQLWNKRPGELLPADYLADLERSRYYIGGRTPWRALIALQGSSLATAKLDITLTNRDKLEVAVADGSATYHAIADLGTDAEAWLARAEWLGFLGENEAALGLYQKAYELDPDNLSAWSILVNSYEYREEYAVAEQYYRSRLARSPLSGITPAELRSENFSPGIVQGHPLAVTRQLAELYVKSDRRPQALALLDEALVVAPDEFHTNMARAGLLIADGEREEQQQFIDALYHRHLLQVEASSLAQSDQQVVLEWYREAYMAWLERHGFTEIYTAMLENNLRLLEAAAGTPALRRIALEQTLAKLAETALARGDFAAYVAWLEQADAQSNRRHHAARLAQYFLGWQGHEPDFESALYWYEQLQSDPLGIPAASRDKHFPLCYLAYRTAKPVSWEAGLATCQQGVEAGEAASSFWLGLLLIDGSHLPQDGMRGEELLRAARAGNYPSFGASQHFDFDIYELGPDLAPFIPALAALAEGGSDIASFFMGKFLFAGIGMARDRQLALQQFERAAARGDMLSQFELGHAFKRLNNRLALPWLERAAEQGYSWASYTLAEIYLEDVLVTRDLAEAERWLTRADEQFKLEWPQMNAGASPAARKLDELRQPLVQPPPPEQEPQNGRRPPPTTRRSETLEVLRVL